MTVIEIKIWIIRNYEKSVFLCREKVKEILCNPKNTVIDIF